MTTTVLIEGFRCTRCRHQWVPRGEGEPKVCPNCKSPYWNRERREKKDERPA